MNAKIQLLIERIFFEDDIGEISFYKGILHISTHWIDNAGGGKIRSGTTFHIEDCLRHPEEYNEPKNKIANNSI
jgi:hypothetical protein